MDLCPYTFHIYNFNKQSQLLQNVNIDRSRNQKKEKTVLEFYNY